MTRPKSEKAARTEALVHEALEGIENQRFKNPCDTAKQLNRGTQFSGFRGFSGLVAFFVT
jgi:hypothetical protein